MSRFGIETSGFGVEILRFGVAMSGFGVDMSGFGLEMLRFGVEMSRFGVEMCISELILMTFRSTVCVRLLELFDLLGHCISAMQLPICQSAMSIAYMHPIDGKDGQGLAPNPKS